MFAAPSAPPLNPDYTILSPRSLNISWYPPPIEHQNGVIKYYVIDALELNTGLTYKYTSNFTWLFLDSLHPYYNYEFMFAAVTVGVGLAGSSITVLTPEDGMDISNN